MLHQFFLFREFVIIILIVFSLIAPLSSLAETTDLGASQTVTGPTTHPFHQSAFESPEIAVSIYTIHRSAHTLVIQLVIHNASKKRQYLLLYGSGKAALDTGAFGYLRDTAGIGICSIYASNAYKDSNVLQDCREKEAKNIDNYSYIEPGKYSSVSMVYRDFQGDVTGANTVSFSFMAIARSAQSGIDFLPVADATKELSIPRVVNIDFSLTPLKDK